jgi:hypothetical protein
VGRYLAAIRGSQTAAASLGISLTRAKVTVFALSAGLAGLGGALYASVQTVVGASDFGYEFSLVWVVAVITTGAMTIEGAIQAGIGYAVLQQVLNLYVPARFNGIEFILFAVGTLTYAQHPEGIVEYQKTRWMNRMAKLFQRYDERRGTGHAGDDGRRLARCGPCRPISPPPVPRCLTPTGPARCSKRGPSPSVSGASRRLHDVTLSVACRARSSAWWVPTAPARRRCSIASVVNCAPTGAACVSTAPIDICPPTGGPGSASAGRSNASRCSPS